MCAYYFRKTRNEERRSVAAREAALEAGLGEPPTLHPVIDPEQCIGCGTCVTACPEGEILGLVNGRAELVEPSRCIGHGACRTACPSGAITLVFGTEKRGVDIPLVAPNFETNIPGIFIAGELGGMGLIRNAIEQGRQALEATLERGRAGRESQLDVVIVGAGPAGFSASLAALQHKLRFVTIEQDTLGGTVSHYPRGKVVMTTPVHLPIFGKVKLRETTKEQLLEFWQGVEEKAGLQVRYLERLEEVTPTADGFQVRTTRGTHETRSVILAIGRRGTPRKLGVPGEGQEKVVFRLIDPRGYRGRHVLVVGGGDSALEAAASLADEPGTTVTLSYRSEAFSRAKPKNRTRVEAAETQGRLRVLLRSQVRSIGPDRVAIDHAGTTMEIPNDGVIVCAGGILPTPFLKKIGIEVETKHGTA
jgi:thioredoxin reductase/ferredoxin